VKRFFSKKKEGRGFGPLNVDIKHPRPLSVAEFDCHACPATSTLLDERCRICVFDRLDVEGDLDRVALRRAYSRIYCSRDVSKLAKTFSSLKQLALDRTLYSKSDTKECKKCVDGRMHELVDETWDKLLANPHDPKPLDDLAQKQRKLKGKCAECTREYYLKLLELIKDGMKSVSTTLRLKPKNYDEVFVARVKPFFVEGIWHPPPSQARALAKHFLFFFFSLAPLETRVSDPCFFSRRVTQGCLFVYLFVVDRSSEASRRGETDSSTLVTSFGAWAPPDHANSRELTPPQSCRIFEPSRRAKHPR